MIKSAIKNQKQNLKIGLYVVLRISEVLIKGTINKTAIAPTMAIIPPTLCGIDLKIA